MAKKNKEKPNDLMGRKQFQDSENYPTQETGLPKDRFQQEVQTSTANQTATKGDGFIPNGSNGPASDSIVARTATAVKKKMAIKPTSETELDDSKLIGGVPLGDSGVMASAAGPLDSEIPVDTSRVPYSKGGYRPNERYGKKISTDNFVINNVVSEQINPSFDEPKDLRESPDSVQGYNGRKQFKSARGKKTYGSHVAAPLFERSIDFEEHSSVIHVTGQVLDNIENKANYPTKENNDDINNSTNFVEARKGNYLIDSFHLEINNGRISQLGFNEMKIESPIDYTAENYANMNWQVDANNVAKAMVKMQTELGRETTDKWSPLGYVIKQPYEYGMLFHDGEAILGSITGAAYRSAAHSLAYLQNKMAKEGIRGLSSIQEWFAENYQHATTSAVYTSDNAQAIFNHDSYSKGSAAALIDMFDSKNKYTTKADFINQPRSFKMHLQTVDNNINPFHAKKQFFKVLDKAMMFSTDDGQYNPVLPVHTTNTIKLMLPYSLNEWCIGWKNPHTETAPTDSKFNCFYRETGLTRGVLYKYNDLRNEYVWQYVDPFVAGLCRWILRHESLFVRAYGNNAAIDIPANFGLTSASMFAFMVCSASQDMAWMRNIIFRDYLFAGEQGVYVWEDLASLSDINPVYASQYTYSDYGSALKLGALSNVSKIRLAWPEVIALKEALHFKNVTGTDTNKPNLAYYMPWYFNEEGIVPTSPTGVSSDKGAVMSYPVIRNGVNHEYVDILYSMTERDVRLCLDRMVTLPLVVDTAGFPVDGATQVVRGHNMIPHYKPYALRYDANSDGRVIMALDIENSDDVNAVIEAHALTEWTYLATPRELGFWFPLPVVIQKPIVTPTGAIGDKHALEFVSGSTSDFLVSYQSVSDPASGNVVDRAASLSQAWIRCFAYSSATEQNFEFVAKTGIVPALSCLFDTRVYRTGTNHAVGFEVTVKSAHDLTTANGIYPLGGSDPIPTSYVSGQGSLIGSPKIFTLARCLWTIVQRSYSPINKYEAAFLSTDIGAEQAIEFLNIGLATDPLEFAEYFGFAGCLASDYNQDVMARLDIKDQLGMFYYEDEFIKSSLIFN